jgi:hypothetical protein
MAMSRTVHFSLIFALVFAAAVIGGIFAFNHYNRLPEKLSQHETLVVGQSRFVPGSQAALRLLVRDSRDGAPLASTQRRWSDPQPL